MVDGYPLKKKKKGSIVGRCPARRDAVLTARGVPVPILVLGCGVVEEVFFSALPVTLDDACLFVALSLLASSSLFFVGARPLSVEGGQEEERKSRKRRRLGETEADGSA